MRKKSRKQNIFCEYERKKAELRAKNLPTKEYETEIKKLAKSLKI